MNNFTEALTSKGKSDIIPEDKNYFGQFVGAWKFDGEYLNDKNELCISKGEWVFSWVLEGKAVQDVFIWPPRDERNIPLGDNEYGTTLRFYNPETEKWDIIYSNNGIPVLLEADKNGKDIVLTEKNEGKMQWIFSDITENNFVWKSVYREEDGTVKQLAKLTVKRVRN